MSPRTRRYAASRIALLLGISAVIVGGCATREVHRERVLPREDPWALLPLRNLSETPRAGERAQSMLATRLRARGIRLLERPAPRTQPGRTRPPWNVDARYRRALEWARKRGVRYAVTGSVEEWRYKSGLDGEPAVALTIRVIRVRDEAVLFSASATRTGWGYQSTSGVAQRILRALTEQIRLSSHTSDA